MQSDKMAALTISGPIERLDDAVRRLMVDQPFHPEDAPSFLSEIRQLRRVETQDPYTPLIAQTDALLRRLGREPAYAEHGEYDVDEIAAYIRSVNDRLAALDDEEALLDADVEADDPIVQYLKNVPVSLRELWQLKYVDMRLGYLPAGKWEELNALVSARPDEFAVEIMRERGYVYFIALALPESADDLDGNLARLNFAPIHADVSRELPDCTAAFLIADADRHRAEEDAKRRDIRAQRETVAAEAAPELLRRRAWLSYEAACVRAKGYAGQSIGRFYITGWTPESEVHTFTEACEAEYGFTCVAAKPREVRAAKPPIRIREKGASAILSPLMKMYGLPAYGTADPRIFMVITYTLFFGMMFGDAGQGLLLAILGFVMYRRSGKWLWRILSLCGLSAIVFGLIYGSVFGLEDLLPWGGFHPLESEHIMPVLLAGAAVGVLVILVCMGFNIVNALRADDLRGALFSPNGVAGAILYVAVLAGIVCSYTGIAKLFTPAYTICLIILPIVLIWLGEPLGKLLRRRPDWQPESWGMYIVEGFFDIFESAISYMSNTMSFLRVGAFAISHAGMMMVVSMLSQGARAAGSVVIMILGNLFVAALETALSSIQIIRLEFYEIFGRFYVSGGREFAPVTVQYTN